METKDIITLAVAGYAAVVSTVVAIHAIAKGRRDRGELRITAEATKRELSPVIPIENIAITATITNTGKRPIGILRWCVCEPADPIYGSDTQDHVTPIDPPKKLEPFENFVSEGPTITARDDAAFRINIRDIDMIYVVDSTEKKWYMSAEELEGFKEEYEKVLKWEEIV